jgi:hypothetical protein
MTRQAAKPKTHKAVLANLVQKDPAVLRSRPAFLSAQWKRDRLIDQILRWHDRQRRAPSDLVEALLSALYRLLDTMDEVLERHDTRSRR